MAQVASGQGGFPSEVKLTGLPIALDDASVRVAVVTEDGDAPVASEVGVRLEVPEPDLRLEPPTDQAIEDARATLERTTLTHESLLKRISRLRSLTAARRPKPEPGHPPITAPREGRRAIVAFRDAELTALESEAFAAEDAVTEARKQLAHLEDDHRRLTTARQARSGELRKSIVCTLTGASSAPRAELRVAYRVPGARWAPSYTVRLDQGLGSAELGVSALVRQATGEDWTDVRVRLSTAAWQQWAELPKLKALRIGRRQPRPAPTWRPPPTGADALFGDYDSGFGSTPAPQGQPAPDESPVMLGGAVEDRTIAERYDAPSELDDHFEDEEVTGSFGMEEEMMRSTRKALPPPQASMSMSMPMSAAAAPPRSRMMKADKKKGGMVFGAGGAAPKPKRPAEPPELVLGDELTAYQNLRIAGPDEAGRGRLVPESQHERYERLLMLQHVHISVDVFQVIAMAASTASEVDYAAPAPRHFFAESDGGFDFAYDVIGTCDVPSDKRDRSLPVALERAPAKPHFVVVPRESRDVFREVRLENPLDAPLLRGPIDVYVGDSYLSTVDLETTAPRGTVRLGLGVEQAIKVSRNARFEEQAAGLIRGSRDLVHDIDVEIQNNLDRAATIEVRERLPVSEERDDDVKVTVDHVEPRWEPYEPEHQLLRGGHRWSIDVAPGAKQKLGVRYTVRIKAGEELVGGNRREV